jgi:hypothetical protein
MYVAFDSIVSTCSVRHPPKTTNPMTRISSGSRDGSCASTGEFIGRVHLPARVRLLAVADAYACIVYDEHVQFLHMQHVSEQGVYAVNMYSRRIPPDGRQSTCACCAVWANSMPKHRRYPAAMTCSRVVSCTCTHACARMCVQCVDGDQTSGTCT